MRASPLSLSLFVLLAATTAAQQTTASAPASPAPEPAAAAPHEVVSPTPAALHEVVSPTPAAKNPPPAHFSYYGTENSALAARVKTVPATDQARLQALQNAFRQS